MTTRDEQLRDERDTRILAVIRALVPGEVVTYGDIAHDAGYPKLSRLVGRLLAITDDDLPWWRVVNSAGRLVPGHEREQTALLKAERVLIVGGRVKSAQLGRFAVRIRPAEPPAARSMKKRSASRRNP